MKVAFSGALKVMYEIKLSISVLIANDQSIFNKNKLNILKLKQEAFTQVIYISILKLMIM